MTCPPCFIRTNQAQKGFIVRDVHQKLQDPNDAVFAFNHQMIFSLSSKKMGPTLCIVIGGVGFDAVIQMINIPTVVGRALRCVQSGRRRLGRSW